MRQQDIQSSLNGYPYHVLIVDDDPVHRALEREILDSSKYAVFETSSGREALDALRSRSFDAVLLDKQMPGMDGDEVCRRIRGELGLGMLPILMVTGNSDIDHLTLSLAAGASDFVRKPYDPGELLARLDAAVSHKRLTDQFDSAESMLFALARMVEAKDGNTGDHCSRLSHNGVVLGKALGLGADELMALRRGGVLHDIGKLGIPDSILLKPGKLTDAEWVIMRQHVDIGARLVEGLKSMRLTVPIIRHHHERWDGSGYPDGLRGEEIPLLARVFQMVDIYDALAHARPYKPAMERLQVIEVLEAEAARGWRDPALTAIFLEIVKTHPEAINVPVSSHDDLGLSLFSEIRSTGALDWDHRPHP
ncbi:MAG: response regulator [Rhodoferax sp.]|uniref:HD-GYP domain-containing protein n=1 Tax=Rhodoferax sp. TaxID=50421 RepID=UPI0017CD7D26|nr:HD domain-containing phosphohydrolase [Rhodoferax sp.]NMM13360.1 response regulator [Rhodoferax sp.]